MLFELVNRFLFTALLWRYKHIVVLANPKSAFIRWTTNMNICSFLIRFIFILLIIHSLFFTSISFFSSLISIFWFYFHSILCLSFLTIFTTWCLYRLSRFQNGNDTQRNGQQKRNDVFTLLHQAINVCAYIYISVWTYGLWCIIVWERAVWSYNSFKSSSAATGRRQSCDRQFSQHSFFHSFTLVFRFSISLCLFVSFALFLSFRFMLAQVLRFFILWDLHPTLWFFSRFYSVIWFSFFFLWRNEQFQHPIQWKWYMSMHRTNAPVEISSTKKAHFFGRTFFWVCREMIHSRSQCAVKRWK